MDTAEATWNESLSPGSGRLGSQESSAGAPCLPPLNPGPSQPGPWVSHSLLIFLVSIGRERASSQPIPTVEKKAKLFDHLMTTSSSVTPDLRMTLRILLWG